jgi:hypothetical protein
MNYANLELKPRLGHRDAILRLKEVLPGFNWRGGDSDYQGTYISGRIQHRVSVKLWSGEDVWDGTVDFRFAKEMDESAKRQQLEEIMTALSEQIGDELYCEIK